MSHALNLLMSLSQAKATASRLVLCALLAILMSGCGKHVTSEGMNRTAPRGTYKPYTINGQTYHPLQSSAGFVEEGQASWYGRDFHGKPTSSGEPYNMDDMTGAHKLLPMHTQVLVTNLENGRRVEIRINDRGPFARGRVLDLSRAAADRLGVRGAGTARVRVEALGGPSRPGTPGTPGAPGYRQDDIPGTFYVQVAAYSRPENAQSLTESMRRRGFGGSRVQNAMVNGKNYWRVQLGTFQSVSAASAALGKLERDFPSSFVIAD